MASQTTLRSFPPLGPPLPGLSQDFQTEWVKLRSKAGKKAGEVRVDYLARYKDDNSFLEALSDEANKVPSPNQTPDGS